MRPAIDEIYIDVSPREVYAIAKQTDRWAEFFPHYRYVRTLSDRGTRKTVEMGALRGAVPVRWRAQQIDDDISPAIAFKHTGGWTAGMSVLWCFVPCGSGTRVTIHHDLRFRFPMSLPPIADRLIGRFFIHHIAQRTLRSIKAIAERSGHA